VIGQAWRKLIKKAGVTHLGFRHLRKTGADMIRRIGGLEVSEAYLAHSEKTLARVYSNRDFDKLADALGTMEAELAAVFA
jgi:integrase